MLMNTIRLSILFCGTLLLASCSKIVDDRNEARTEIVLTRAQGEYVKRGNDFGFSMLQKMGCRGNILFSPLSSQIAMGLVVPGAVGNTSKEIISAIGFGSDDEETIEYISYLSEQLRKSDKKTDFALSNALVINTSSGHKLSPSYVNTLSSYLRCMTIESDFAQDKDKTILSINNWASRNTNGLIPTLIDDPAQLSSTAISVLLNALFFKSSWTIPFDVKNTVHEDFYAEDKSVSQKPMMRKTDSLEYYEDENKKALSMSYGNGAFCFTAILPGENTCLSELIMGLNEQKFHSVVNNMKSQLVSVFIPKFTIEKSIDMVGAYLSVGIEDAFSETDANFEKMIDGQSKGVYISNALQKLYFRLDESGAEAAAVTQIVIDEPTSPDPGSDDLPMVFKANHPFLYIIHERSSGAILFMGLYAGSD